MDRLTNEAFALLVRLNKALTATRNSYDFTRESADRVARLNKLITQCNERGKRRHNRHNQTAHSIVQNRSF